MPVADDGAQRSRAAQLTSPPFSAPALGDRGYDSNHFRADLAARGIVPCIPSTRSRKVPIPHDAVLYRQRHRIKIMFGGLKHWRRIHNRYNRCAHTFFSAVRVAAVVPYGCRNESRA